MVIRQRHSSIETIIHQIAVKFHPNFHLFAISLRLWAMLTAYHQASGHWAPIEEQVMDEQLRYQSYLLKVWQSQAAASYTWRMLLVDVQSGRRLGFSHPDDFFFYLRSQIAPGDDCDMTVRSDSRGPPSEDQTEPH